MTLSCLIYCVPGEVFSPLMELLSKIGLREQVSLQVTMRTDLYQDAVDFLEEEPTVKLVVTYVDDFSAKTGKQAVEVGKKAISQNRDSYVIYCARNSRVMIDMAPYCVKPAGLTTADSILTRSAGMMTMIMRDYRTAFSQAYSDDGRWINLKIGGQLIRVNVDEITEVEANNKMVTVRTLSNVYQVNDTLERICEILGDSFFRCHRSCLINTTKIQYVDFRNMMIVLMDGTKVPLSRSFKQAVKQLMNGNPEKEGV